MSGTELLSCPFCGGEDVHVGWTDFDSGVIFVECETCGMYCEPKDCYANEPKAVEAWNARAERTCRKVPGVYAPNALHCSRCGVSLSLPDNYCWQCGAKVVEQ